MNKQQLSGGVVHTLPHDMRTALRASAAAMTAWEDISPLARNEWICWVTSAKLQETRTRRARRTIEDLEKGKRRPCCWAGCPHR